MIRVKVWGENIQPEEIERVLLAIQGVSDALVVGRPDERYGQRPVAYIKTEKDVDGEILRESLLMTLPAYKIPDDFLPWPEEQRSDTSLKSNLRQLLTNQWKDDPC
ncbi:MAG: AMP-binding enzyme [Methylococcaceae bacterium]